LKFEKLKKNKKKTLVVCSLCKITISTQICLFAKMVEQNFKEFYGEK